MIQNVTKCVPGSSQAGGHAGFMPWANSKLPFFLVGRHSFVNACGVFLATCLEGGAWVV